MSVQYDEAPSKTIQDIVLYCLTPAGFRRYSSLNFVRATSSRNETDGRAAEMSIVSGVGGIGLVNRFIPGGLFPLSRKFSETWGALISSIPTSRKEARSGGPNEVPGDRQLVPKE